MALYLIFKNLPPTSPKMPWQAKKVILVIVYDNAKMDSDSKEVCNIFFLTWNYEQFDFMYVRPT